MIRSKDTVMLTKREFDELASKAVAEFRNEFPIKEEPLLELLANAAFMGGIATIAEALFEEDEK